jgi:hypothetical protein
MKRVLLDNVKVIPYKSADTFDKLNFASAVLGASVSKGGTMSIQVRHCDEIDGEFEDVADPRVLPDGSSIEIDPEAVESGAVIVNAALDLEGCKRYVQIITSMGENHALTLGDPTYMPIGG